MENKKFRVADDVVVFFPYDVYKGKITEMTDRLYVVTTASGYRVTVPVNQWDSSPKMFKDPGDVYLKITDGGHKTLVLESVKLGIRRNLGSAGHILNAHRRGNTIIIPMGFSVLMVDRIQDGDKKSLDVDFVKEITKNLSKVAKTGERASYNKTKKVNVISLHTSPDRALEVFLGVEIIEDDGEYATFNYGKRVVTVRKENIFVIDVKKNDSMYFVKESDYSSMFVYEGVSGSFVVKFGYRGDICRFDKGVIIRDNSEEAFIFADKNASIKEVEYNRRFAQYRVLNGIA